MLPNLIFFFLFIFQRIDLWTFWEEENCKFFFVFFHFLKTVKFVVLENRLSLCFKKSFKTTLSHFCEKNQIQTIFFLPRDGVAANFQLYKPWLLRNKRRCHFFIILFKKTMKFYEIRQSDVTTVQTLNQNKYFSCCKSKERN